MQKKKNKNAITIFLSIDTIKQQFPFQIMVPNVLTGKRAVVATLTPGNYFGEISLLKMDEGQNR